MECLNNPLSGQKPQQQGTFLANSLIPCGLVRDNHVTHWKRVAVFLSQKALKYFDVALK